MRGMNSSASALALAIATAALGSPAFAQTATTPANAGDSNWRVLAGGDYGVGPAQTGTPLPGSKDIVWRNATSGNMVVWHMDFAGSRTSGEFTNPTAPTTPLDWTVAGPR